MAVLRQSNRECYTVIDNTVFFDKQLSYKAKGLLCQMLSLPDGWEFSIAGLAKLASDGRDSVASALRELEEMRYFRREQVRDGGKFEGVEYVVAEKPFTENPLTENPITEKPQQLNTNTLNTNKSNTKDIGRSATRKKPKKKDLHADPSQRPTLSEVRAYVAEKGLTGVNADYFYEYFTEGEWLDSLGNPVQNWKQKLITWSNKGRTGKNENTRIGKASSKPDRKDYGDFSDFGKVSF